MVHLGMLEGEVDALIEDESYKRFYMHRTSHWLGMDVHDVGAYYIDGESRPLQAGMVLTIEPGIYVAADDEQAPEAYRGIGVRIEDDILVTEDGYENLTAAIPKTVEEVERACGA
jgi:Xaa-Pro aminopeptidase